VYSDVPPEELNLIWCDRTGKKLSTIGEPAVLNMPALSPDGRYLASLIRLEKGVNIWIHDLERQIKTRFTMGEVAHCCVEWSPSGEEITFASNPQGNFDIFSKPSNGRGETKLLAGTQLREGSPTWSPVGRFLMYQVMSPETNADLLYRERKSSGQMGEPTPFLATPSREMAPRFSPDGRYVAYISDESGREEIYVRSFPGGEKQWQISTNGGAAPRWRRDGREIFYVEPWHRLMAVGISNPNGFSPGAPQALFENTGLFQGGYDATADGQRFVVRERLTQKEPLAIHIVHNWFEEFRDSGQQKQP
jgi:Tol biopolymer transport system component